METPFYQEIPKELDLYEITGSALEPINDVVKELNKLIILVNTILSTYSAENQSIILAEFQKRISEASLKKT